MTNVWLAGTVAAGLGVLWLWLPGLLAGYAVGLRGLALGAISPALSFAGLGCGALVASMAGVRWGVWAGLGATLLTALIAQVAGYFFPLIRSPRALPVWSRPSWMAVGGVAAAAALGLFGSALVGMGNPGAILQRWDMATHANLVRLIRETGNASPFHMDLSHFPEVGNAYYPAGLHAVVALLPEGIDLFVAWNMVVLVAECAIWTVGVVYLSRVLFPGSPKLAMAAAAGSFVFQSTPLALVLQAPNAVGVAMLPALVGWSVQVARLIKLRAGGVVGRSLVLAVGLLGISLAHPIALFSYAVLAAPIASYIVVTLTIRGWHRAWRWATVACLAALTGLTVLAGVGVISEPRVRAVLDFTPWERGVHPLVALGGGITDATSLFQRIPNLAALILVAVGIAVVLRRRSHRWLVISYGLLLLLYACAAISPPGLRFVTGLWYGDRGRIGVLITVAAIPLASLGARRLWRLIRQPAAGRRWLKPAAAVAAAAAFAGGLAVVAIRPSIYAAQGFALASTDQRPRFFGPEELAMTRRISQSLPEEGLILGDPFNGSVMAYAVAGREVVFGTLSGPWTKDRRYLIDHFPELGQDPAVCDVLDRLDARFYYADPQIYYDTRDFASMTSGLDLDDRFELIDSGGSASLWRITACNG
ncbi:MAG: hypothetical protein LBJ02_01725 [Bifidobacteriaceae bacterium]|jgi:hypothetical protein|nr:hypothetical protein [Bifidobacteriaceae bacterium]